MLPLLSKVILYIQLETEFQSQQESLEAYIRDLFPEELLELAEFIINGVDISFKEKNNE
jgi:hypothetical protein